MTALNDNSIRFRAYAYDLGKNYGLKFAEDQTDKLEVWMKEVVEVAEEISIVSLDPEEIEIDFACFLPDVAVTVMSVDNTNQTAVMHFMQGAFQMHANVELDVITEEEFDTMMAEGAYFEV